MMDETNTKTLHVNDDWDEDALLNIEKNPLPANRDEKKKKPEPEKKKRETRNQKQIAGEHQTVHLPTTTHEEIVDGLYDQILDGEKNLIDTKKMYKETLTQLAEARTKLEAKETIQKQTEANLKEKTNELENTKTQLNTMITENDKLRKTNEKLRLINKEMLIRLAKEETPTEIKANTPNILLLADSNGRRLEQGLKNTNNFNLRFIQKTNLQRANEFISSPEGKEAIKKCDAVITLLGTNDIGSGSKASTTYLETTRLVQKISSMKKHAAIMEIPHTRDDTTRNVETSIHNLKIQNLKDISPYVTTINYTELIEHLTNEETFEDHIHLNQNEKAAKTIIEIIEKHIQETSFEQLEETKEKVNPPTHLQKIPEKDTKKWSINIAKEVTGFIIGKNRTNKLRLENTYNVKIEIIPGKDGADTIFIIQGSPENLTKTKTDINSSISNIKGREKREPRTRERGREGRSENYRSRSPVDRNTWQDNDWQTGKWSDYPQ